MALQVWLPLTKDLKQQGLSDVIVTNNGTTFNSAGKLGGCYYFNGDKQWLQFNSVLGDYYNNDWSIACWLKPTDSTRSVIISEYSSTGASNVGLELTTSRVVRLYWNGSPDINFTTAGALPLNEWTHLAMTKAGREVKVYFNGILKQTYTNSSDFSTRTSAAQPRIGDDYRGNSANTVSYQGYINDFRMYDHCLSPMEVKELSKGLVLHYPLNRQGWGQENLYTGSRDYSGTWVNGSAWTTSSENYESFTVKQKSTVWGGLAQNVTCSNGDVFTISFYAKVTSGGNILSIHRSSLGNVTTGLTILGGNFSSGTTWVNTTENGSQWKRYWATVQIASSDITYLQWRIENSVADKILYICGMKLEKGSIATPWSPNSSDALATTLGLNGTTEYDCSGYCNNGTRVGTLGWSSNTPKYNVSLDVASDSCARYIYGPAQTQLTDQITLACWLYQTSATATSGGNSTTNQFALSQGRDYLNLGFNITVNNGKPGVYAGNGGSESGARVSLISTTKTITGSWHHVAATYNNGALKLYVDGQLDRETTIGALDYVDAPALVVGKMAYGYTNGTSYFPFIGYISDCRVYATALSADDVKSLYQNSAYIDSSGNVYGAVHTEV